MQPFQPCVPHPNWGTPLGSCKELQAGANAEADAPSFGMGHYCVCYLLGLWGTDRYEDEACFLPCGKINTIH